MKHNKIFRILALAIILSLLVVALPATPTHAAPLIYLIPDEGEPGDRIKVDGRGFFPNKDVYIYFSSQEAFVDDFIDYEVTIYKSVLQSVTDEGGFLPTRSFYVPDELTVGHEAVHRGNYYVYAAYPDTRAILAFEVFTVIGGVSGAIELDPDEGLVGDEIEISGEGFDDREEITIEYDGDEVNIESGDDDTDSDGEFECTIIIPESTGGDHTITVIGEDSDIETEAEFTVESEIIIIPESGGAGDTVTVSGTGFGDRSDLTIYFENFEVATDETDRDGSFETTFTVPQMPSGTYYVEVEDEDDNFDDAKFTVSITTEATISQTVGNVGTEITISGTGFMAGGAVTIKYDDIAIATATADSNGIFSATFKVPASQHGDHSITASDIANTKTYTFTMESKPPPAPALALPEDGSEPEAEIHFDWDDVDDPSQPVTYTFQIASDKDFTTIVLEEKDLTESEYTITEEEKEEKLEETEKEAPYYWRVKATDGAANEGEWSTPSSFYVAVPFAFEMPSWVIYALIGLGVVLFFLLGFWAGRKTAYV